MVLLIFLSHVIFGVLLLNQERVRSRDAKRIADITQIRYAFEILFNEKNSYAEASQGCAHKGSLVSTCNLSLYLSNIAKIKDPGKYSYKINTVPSEKDFEVVFYLEKDYDSLKGGKHLLTPQGIK